MTLKDIWDFISLVADQAFSFEFRCLGYNISFYNLMFCSLIFVGFFAILGVKLDLGVDKSNQSRQATRRDKIRKENEKRNEVIRQAKKDGVPLKK